MNNVSGAKQHQPLTDLFLLDYWGKWCPVCTIRKLTFGAHNQFIHLSCLIMEKDTQSVSQANFETSSTSITVSTAV